MSDQIGSRIRGDLAAALKARDPVAVAALRSALAALDNAGAVEVPASRAEVSEHFAGAVAGVCSTEVARRVLTEDDARAMVRSQFEELSRAAKEYDRLSRHHLAERLREEAEVLAPYLGSPIDTAGRP